MNEHNLSVPELIEAIAYELDVKNVDANLITLQKVEVVFNGLNGKSLAEIEAFFK